MPQGEPTSRIEDLLGLLVRQTRDVSIILLDTDGTVVGWLGAAALLFGREAPEAIGTHFEFLFTEDDRAAGLPALELTIAAANSRAEDDRWHVRKDGSRLWISGVTVPLRADDGTLVGYAKVGRDRTDLKMQLDALANRVEALTAAHEERALFLKTLGHELRNPLAPLRTATALLRRVREPAAMETALGIIDRQLASIQRLADDLSDLTRMEIGRLGLQRQPIDLQETLAALVRGYLPEATRRGLRLLLLMPDAPIRLDVDPGRFQQIMMNLLGNALKYTPSGGTIWLKATTEGQQAVIRVEDTGQGIAAETLPRIFELFTQENPDGAESDGGMGIGLALVSRLVRMHGGVVEVRSPGKGRGSEFTVRLPLTGDTLV
ncbi:MAG TPA: PAS domain-containing sensor histidine kinase [Albitalea sp.]|nr:PAS domain-containing sensor histidine kinase [Albitalea sp.]